MYPGLKIKSFTGSGKASIGNCIVKGIVLIAGAGAAAKAVIDDSDDGTGSKFLAVNCAADETDLKNLPLPGYVCSTDFYCTLTGANAEAIVYYND